MSKVRALLNRALKLGQARRAQGKGLVRVVGNARRLEGVKQVALDPGAVRLGIGHK
jgi:hypothetical protein